MEIERVSQLTREEFEENYRKPGRPVILTEQIADWPATQKWSPDYFEAEYGDCEVQLQVLEREIASNTELWLDELQHEKTTIHAYLQRMKQYGDKLGGRVYLAQWPLVLTDHQLRNDIRDPGIYPENWPEVRHRLRRIWGFTPLFWMGPAGCVTGLHYDSFENFVYQFWGRKEWVVFPCDQRHLLYLPSCLRQPQHSPVDCEAPDHERFPRFKHATPMRFFVEPGEMLYLPQCWPHHVRTLEFSISVNAWWVRSIAAFARGTFPYISQHIKNRIRKALGFHYPYQLDKADV